MRNISLDTETLIPSTDTIKDGATLSNDENGKDNELILVGKGKENTISSNEIDLKEEIGIPNWDPSNLFAENIEILGEL